MKESTYRELRDFVHRKAGIHLGDSRQALVQARVGQRLRALGLSDPDDYVARVLEDPAGDEIVNLLDAISTNYTSFFREPDHFAILAEELRRRRAKGQERFRIWCAAASTGEEPYTLSMVAQEALGEDADLRILATDLSTRVLRTCREGVYNRDRLDGVSEERRRRWFRPVSREGGFEAGPALRAPLSFARLNLVEHPYPMQGPFDVIFCRNVMIYFDNHGRAGFAREARRLVPPGGLLVVGHSETLSGLADGFRPIQPSVYKREGP